MHTRVGLRWGPVTSLRRRLPKRHCCSARAAWQRARVRTLQQGRSGACNSPEYHQRALLLVAHLRTAPSSLWGFTVRV
jgi:hypothetical protein